MHIWDYKYTLTFGFSYECFECTFDIILIKNALSQFFYILSELCVLLQGGINEWLLQPFGPGSSSPCEKLTNPGSVSFTLDIPGEQPQEPVQLCLILAIFVSDIHSKQICEKIKRNR